MILIFLLIIEFYKAEDAAEAQNALDGSRLGDRDIVIVFAKDKRKTPQEMRAVMGGGGGGGGYRNDRNGGGFGGGRDSRSRDYRDSRGGDYRDSRGGGDRESRGGGDRDYNRRGRSDSREKYHSRSLFLYFYECLSFIHCLLSLNFEVKVKS